MHDAFISFPVGSQQTHIWFKNISQWLNDKPNARDDILNILQNITNIEKQHNLDASKIENLSFSDAKKLNDSLQNINVTKDEVFNKLANSEISTQHLLKHEKKTIISFSLS